MDRIHFVIHTTHIRKQNFNIIDIFRCSSVTPPFPSTIFYFYPFVSRFTWFIFSISLSFISKYEIQSKISYSSNLYVNVINLKGISIFANKNISLFQFTLQYTAQYIGYSFQCRPENCGMKDFKKKLYLTVFYLHIGLFKLFNWSTQVVFQFQNILVRTVQSTVYSLQFYSFLIVIHKIWTSCYFKLEYNFS